MVITHKPLYFSTDTTKCGVFIKVSTYLDFHSTWVMVRYLSTKGLRTVYP